MLMENQLLKMMANFQETFQETFEEKVKNAHYELKKPNILVAGQSGAGKSSLINAIFGSDVARVGAGKPVTEYYDLYSSDDVLVNIYDSAGWEGGSEKEAKFFDDTKEFLDKTTGGIEEQVHIIWYAVAASGARFFEFEVKIIKELFKDIPILFCLTKGDIASDDLINALRETIEEKHFHNSRGIFDISADPLYRRGKPICDPYGLDVLVKKTVGLLPDLSQRAFIAAQKVSLREKDIEAKSSILKFVAGSFGVGFSPIPFSDAPILIGLQVTMVARIAVIYGLSSSGGISSAVIGGLGVGSGVAGIGTTAANLLKIIPGIGSILGGAIDATVASTITYIMGFSFRALFHEIVKSSIEGESLEINPEWMVQGVQKAYQHFKKGKTFDTYDDLY